MQIGLKRRGGSDERACCCNRLVRCLLCLGRGENLQADILSNPGWLDIDKLVEYRDPPEDVGLGLNIWNKPRVAQCQLFRIPFPPQGLIVTDNKLCLDSHNGRAQS